MQRFREGSRFNIRARPLCRLLAAVAVWSAFATVTPAQEPLYTRNPRFRIPFQFDSAEMQRIGAVEVQLHVSTSQGLSWQLAESVAPSAQKFVFEAPRNGEYRFAVRTLDARNGAHPAGPLQAGLIVIVDDLPPVLRLELAQDPSGTAELTWEAIDEYVDLGTLRLEYLDPTLGAWQFLNVTPSERGRMTLRAPASGELMVRGSLSDRAGNGTQANAALSVTGRAGSGQPSQQEQLDFRQPIAERSAEPQLSRSNDHTPIILPNVPHAPVPASPATAAAPEQWGRLTRPASTVKGPVPIADQPEGAPSVELPAGPSPNPALPSNARRVNSRNFRIGYSVRDVGPSGVNSVDLYITENGGRKWFHYGTDPDRQSPYDVLVPRDGTYGFAIRVRNGIGLVADPPQPGEIPEMAVIVDQVPPTARLMPLQQVSQGAAHSVRITWTAGDESLAERPVALYYSATAQGPWEPITGWIDNSERHDWPVTAAVPSSLYVRLDARDAAGNVTTVTTDRPLLVDTSRPTAHILDVESVHAPAVPR